MQTIIEKEDVALDLVELEMAGKLAMNESTATNNNEIEGEDMFNLSMQLADVSLMETGETPRKKPVPMHHKRNHEPFDISGLSKTDVSESSSQCIEQQDQKTENSCESETEDSSSEYTTDSESSEDESDHVTELNSERSEKDPAQLESTPDPDQSPNGQLITELNIEEIPGSDSAKNNCASDKDTPDTKKLFLGELPGAAPCQSLNNLLVTEQLSSTD